MNPKEIDLIQKRWIGGSSESDVQKLIDEITRLSDIVETQTDTIEDKMWDELIAELEKRKAGGRRDA